jgi:hypothetical protein
MPTLQQLQTALIDTPNLSEAAFDYANSVIKYLNKPKSVYFECPKTTLGELARALQVETHWNGLTYSLTIENGAHQVILQTPVISK